MIHEEDTSLDWRRSEFCGSDACVEVSASNGAYYVRDSKNLERPPLAFDRAEWTAFVAGVRAGNFDFD